MKKKRYHRGITLVLSGGGAKGLAHIGVIEELVKNKIKINRIVGTSAGALVGGFYAAGKLNELKKILLGLTAWDVFKLFFSFPKHDFIFNLKKIDLILQYLIKDIKIEDLKIPFTAVAFDLIQGKKVIFEKGNLFQAVRASISIPGFFRPFQLGGSLFIDGGVIDIVPVDVAQEYKEKNKILAVNLETHSILKTDKLNLLKILDVAAYIQTKELARLQEKDADLVLKPDLDIGHFEFHKGKEIIPKGRRVVQEHLKAIKKLAK